MSPLRRFIFAILVGGSIMIAGCYGEVFVRDRPPAARVEVVETAPSPRHVWIEGHWAWSGDWVWVRGRWEVPPHEREVWVAGHWQETPRGWRWIEGHWRD